MTLSSSNSHPCAEVRVFYHATALLANKMLTSSRADLLTA